MKTFLRKSGFFAIVFVIANLFFSSAAFGQAAITSDQPDYLPGTTAIFTGIGFQPGETVSIQVLHSDIYPVDTAGVEHQPWNVTADASGNFVTTWQVSLTHCLGKLLRATAIGQSSGENVWTEFTDPTITSTGSGGNWNDGGTWVGGNIPLATDDVIIAVGATVTVSDNSSAKSITLAGGSSNTKLQINSGITLSVSGNVTINAPGANGITNNLDVGAGILNVVGNVSIDGANGGTGRKGILSISTGTVDLTGNVANPSNNSNAQIKFSDIGTLKIGGNFVWGSSSTFTPGTGTVEYKGAAQTILAATYNNLSFSGTGAKTMRAATTVNGDVTINSGVTFDEAGMQMTLGSGSELTVNGTLDFSSSSGLIRSATSGTTTLTMGSTGKIRTVDALGLGPVANASLVTQAGGAWATSSINTNGTVEYYLNATQAVTDRDYNNLIITNTGTKTWTLGATRTISGNFTINSSVPLTLSGAQTLNIKGNWSNSGTFTPGSSTILFNGGSTQNIGGSIFTNFNNLSIASGTSVNLGTLSHTAAALTLGGAGTVSGTWGSTSSSPLAAHINNTYFAATTGKVTVGTDTRTNSTIIATGTTFFTYNGLVQGPTTSTVTGSTGLVTYSYSGVSPTVYSASATRPINAGTYQVIATVAADANYNGATSVALAFTIGKASASVIVDSGQTKEYGSADPTLTGVLTGFMPADVVTAAYSRVAGETVLGGPYAITAILSPAGVLSNYAITNTGAALTITKATATLALGNLTGHIYDGAEKSATASVSPTGLTGVSVSGSGTNAGSYPASSSLINDNYEATTVNGSLEIGKADAVIAVIPYSVTYDALAHTSLGSATGVSSEALAGLVLSGTTHTAAGIYTGDSWTFTDVTGNYNDDSGTVDNAIGKANAVVTVSGYTGIYDTAAHGATGSVVGVVGDLSAVGGSLSLGTTFTDYPGGITSWTFTGGSNYVDQSGTAAIVINKAILSVTADNKSKYCGQVDPTLTGVLSGVLGSDGITATYGTIATQASTAGTYDITPTLSDPNNKLVNYSVASTNGTLTVNPINTVNLYDLSPVAIGTSIILKARVVPAVANVPISLYNDGSLQGIVMTSDGTGTTTLGEATLPIGTLPEEVYGVSAVAGNSCATSTPGFLPVYDPARGFAAGNGSFDSLAGAYPTISTFVGKARFGFSVKYKKGTILPQGELDFQLKKTKLKFESTSFQWLVIAGNKSQFKGTGKINGSGTYNFIVTAIDNGTCEMEDEHDGDGDDDRDHHNGYDRDENHPGYHRDGKKCNDRKCTIPDQFRIQITTTTGTVVYDNQMGQLVSEYAASNITRGAIEVNDTKITKKVVAAPETTNTSTLFVYPNPTSYKYTLFLEGGSKEKVQVEVYDMTGRLLKHIESSDGQVIEFGEDLPTGAYFTTVSQGTYQKTVRLIKQ